MLDVDLRGEAVYPLAEALRARGVPFLFLTGYGQLAIPEPWRGAVRVEKPFDEASLLGALARLMAPDGGPARATAGAGSATAREPQERVRRTWEIIRESRNLVTEGQIRCAATRSGTKLPGQGW